MLTNEDMSCSEKLLVKYDDENNEEIEEDEEGYDFEFTPSLNLKFSCPVCLLVVRRPVQTKCGHRFCYNCIIRCIRKTPRCPLDQEPISENELFQDRCTEREVLGLNVRCRNKCCDEMVELRYIKDHEEVCLFKEVFCDLGCGKKVLLKDKLEHEKDFCEKRLVKCNDCQQMYPIEEEEIHVKDDCIHANRFVQCTYCLHEMKAYKMKNHVTHDCQKAPIKCVFHRVGCLLEHSRLNISQHMEQSTQIHLQYLLNHVMKLQNVNDKFENNFLEMETKLEKISLSPNISRRTSEINLAPGGSSYNLELTSTRRASANSPAIQPAHSCSQIQTYKCDHDDKLITIEHLVREITVKIDSQHSKLKKMNKRLEEVESSMMTQSLKSCNGVYYWRITNYLANYQSALDGDCLQINSPGFYTSYYGYRLCARTNLNGVNESIGRDMSFFVHIMKGDNDDLVMWPFSGKISMTMINQVC